MQLRQWWAEQSRNTRIALVGVVVIVVLGGGIAGALAMTGGRENAAAGGETPGVTISTTGAGPNGTAGGTGAADAVSTVPPIDDTPEDLAALRIRSGLPTVTNIGDLHSKYGEPPDAKFGRVRIPTLGVDAPLGGRVVGTDGLMKVPAGPADVVWYDFSRWPGLGGVPGAGGNAVFSGHVDYAARIPYANVNYRGRGVLYGLGLLANGDEIEVEWFGRKLKYAVISRQTVSAERANWNEIFATRAQNRDSITLITCAGQFDATKQEYSDRVIVQAVRV